MRERIVSILILGLLLGAGFLSLGLLNLEGPIGEADGLDINGLTVLSSNTAYGEDVYIKNGGTLRIMAGVTLGMAAGTSIVVEDGGTLEILGEINKKVWVQTSTAGTWSGIYAYADSVILIKRAEIRFAGYGLNLEGTGHSTSSGSVSVNDTSFTTCTTAVYANGAGNSAPFNFHFWDNYINNPDHGIYIENGYNGITVENNFVNNAFEYGFYLAGIGNVNVWNNTITNSHRALLIGGTVSENLVENNTISDCYWGFYGAFLGNAKFRNNSLFTIGKSIYLPLATDILIENNTITSTGNGWNPPLDVYDDDGVTIIKNNIISGCGPLIFANGTSPAHFKIYKNLLLNLTELRYVDSMGDGFVDIRVPCEGTAGAFAKMCRTSVFYMNQPGIVESYVTPKQASEHARVGSTLKMISNPVGYGPKMLEDRHIYHTQLPIITWPMNFTGEERDYLVFYPGDCMNAATIQNTDHAGLHNFSVRSGPYTVHVSGSNNITLSGISSHTYDDIYQSGIYIYESENVHVRDCYLSQSYVYGLHIQKTAKVSLQDVRLVGSTTYGAYISDSYDLTADNTSLSFMDNYGIYCELSSISWNDSEVRGSTSSLHLVDSIDSEFMNMEFRTINTASRNVIIDNSPGTIFKGCAIFTGYHIPDIHGIYMINDVQYTMVESCFFQGDPGHTNVIAGIYTDGNITGSYFGNNTFQYMTAGMGIGPAGSHDLNDVTVYGGLFTQNTAGIVGNFIGDVYLEGIEIRQGDTGIQLMRGDVFATDLNIYQVDTGMVMQMNRFDLWNSYINAGVESLNVTDTDGSYVKDTDLDNIPISMNLFMDAENHMWFDNCTGDETLTKIHGAGCYANWTWPLQVNIYDEIGELQPAHLSVSSPTFGEVLNRSIDGSYYIEDLLGWWTDFSGYNDVSDYTVRVMDNENYQTDHPTMLSYQISEFIFNHAPTLNSSAPGEIYLNEDEIWSEDISGWFNDRDALTIELDSVLGANMQASLDGTVLTIRNSGKDRHGSGEVHFIVTDTFDEELVHWIDVYIEPVNDAPVFGELPVLNITEDQSEWINFTIHTSDVDGPNLSVSNDTADNFTLVWSGPMNVTIMPEMDWFGTQNITFYLTDGEHTVQRDLVANVLPVNDAPVWEGEAVIDITVNAGQTGTIDISGLYTDIDDAIGDIEVTFNNDHASISGDIISIIYPGNTLNMSEMITVTISDGELSATFMINVTVIERILPPDGWDIIDSDVTIDPDTGDWTVEVSGGEEQDIYIVIDGVGSYKLNETSPGEYTVTIAGSDFEEGSSYGYHFSNTDGGEDRTDGSHTGSMEQPTLTDDDDDDDTDDDDDDGGDKDDDFPVWLIVLGIIIVLLIIVIAFLVISSRGESDYYDEE